jgi:splicing factor 3B subunit 4
MSFLVNVHIPRDKLTKEHSTYGFVEFRTEQDAEYAIKIMNMVRLYGKPMKCNKVWVRNFFGFYKVPLHCGLLKPTCLAQGSRDKKTNDVGANLFIGSLDLDADERTLQEVFGSFGQLISPPKIMRDEQNRSKGFGFVSYDSFESADAAIAAMHGQWLMNKFVCSSVLLTTLTYQPTLGKLMCNML